MVIGLAVIALSNAGMAWFGSIAGMSVAMFGLGLGWCLSYIAATTELVDLAGPSERGRLVGFSDLLSSFGAAGARPGGRRRLHGRGRFGAARRRGDGARGSRVRLGRGEPRWASGTRRRRLTGTMPVRRIPGPPFLRMKTYSAKPGEIQRDWLVVDAEGKTLGRLATQIADRLRGKGKPTFTPHVDTGDFVVVVNAEKIAVTGKKLDEKMYYRHSGYPGGLRQRTLREQLERQPTEVLRKAVKGMLPRNKLGRAQLTKLKIYAGPEHPHEAQAPTLLEV